MNTLDEIKQPESEISEEESDSLFDLLPEGTRIVIHNGTVTFENLTPEFLDVALSLNPDDPSLKQRKSSNTGESR